MNKHTVYTNIYVNRWIIIKLSAPLKTREQDLELEQIQIPELQKTLIFMHRTASSWPCLETVLLTCFCCLAAKAKVQSSACPTWLTRPYERAFLLQLVACGGNNRGITCIPLVQNTGMFPALLMWQCRRATTGAGEIGSISDNSGSSCPLPSLFGMNRTVKIVPGLCKVPKKKKKTIFT